MLLSRYSEQVQALNEMTGENWPRMGIGLSRTQLVEILDRVRNLVLDWALELERQGISGSELGFNAEDKQRAQEQTVHFHIGSIGTVSGSLNAAVDGENARINFGSADHSKNDAKR